MTVMRPGASKLGLAAHSHASSEPQFPICKTGDLEPESQSVGGAC